MRLLHARGPIALALGFTLTVSTAAAATPPLGHFGRLFPDLPANSQATSQQIADLAQTMLDPGDDSENNCPPSVTAGPECLPSGFTYFGQFLDHDLTLDTSPSPTATVDPTTLTNFRTLRLDLDALYGAGPQGAPQFYAADHKHFLLPVNANGVVDLPRTASGQAILVEGRNDENQIISQIERAFMLAHNRLIDEGLSFDRARRVLTLHYQWAVLHDFLPHILDLAHGDVTRLAGAALLRLLKQTPQTTMVEFSVAAYRFGHSQVRAGYEVNEDSGVIPVFSATEPDLRGGQPLTDGRTVAWGNFFNELAAPDDADGLNISRKIDPLISASLFALPIPGAEAAGSNVLAFRNMIRAKFYNMPSGQAVARALGQPVITPAQLNLGPGFESGTPLWFYILAEASRTTGGRTLGPVGSIIVGGTFLSLLVKDPDSILTGNRSFRPDPRIAGDDGVMSISDLFVFAGVATAP
jgi:hypothetical protein